MIEYSIVNKNMDRLLHRCTTYLYTLPKTHNQFAIETENKCDDTMHILFTKENRYGQALIITQECMLCKSCYAEVFPPRGNC